jgi:hypothetical protein
MTARDQGRLRNVPGPKPKKPRKPPPYGKNKMFFYDGHLYRRLKTDKGKNILWAWDVQNEKRVIFTYSDYKRKHKKAYSTSDVCAILDRARDKIYKLIAEGHIPEPVRIGERTNDITSRARYWWSEEDIFNIQQYWVERIKAGGRNIYVPTREEIMVLLRDDLSTIYRKDEDGEFVPVFQA